MNRADEQRLEKVVNGRHRLMRQEAKKRAAELKAEVEDQLNAAYHFDDDEIWAEAMSHAEASAREAQKTVAARCRELGIPAQFQPRLDALWQRGGGTHLVKEAKDAARRQAHARIEALLQSTLMACDDQKLRAQTELLAGNLEGVDAKNFLESLPEVSALMPKVTVNAHKLLQAKHVPHRYNVVNLPSDLLDVGDD